MKENILTILAALAVLSGTARAGLSGGAFEVPSMASLAGGAPASGGAFSLAAAGMGGPAFSLSAPFGGAFSLAAGSIPAMVVIETARDSLASAHCYPVPFRPSAGHTVITFTGLTRSAEVRIYTLSGELVRKLEKNDSGQTLDWDARNSRGERLASGVYIFTISGGGEKADGKLMIIW